MILICCNPRNFAQPTQGVGPVPTQVIESVFQEGSYFYMAHPGGRACACVSRGLLLIKNQHANQNYSLQSNSASVCNNNEAQPHGKNKVIADPHAEQGLNKLLLYKLDIIRLTMAHPYNIQSNLRK